MDTKDFSKAQGHWILARMGKKVLRPGGKELTQKLVTALEISSEDNIVEFAPGLGFTASLALKKQPKTYVGIDADEDAVDMLQHKLKGNNIQFVLANASSTKLSDNSKDKVWGEAMLTMHNDHRKSEIIREAHRILKKGGLYAIHGLGLVDVNETSKSEIQKDLAFSIKVNARPLTESEWKELLEKEGFSVKKVFTNQMLLLETRRILDDEGWLGTLKIGMNVLLNPAAMKRIVEMRSVFQKHQRNMNAIAIVAEKN